LKLAGEQVLQTLLVHNQHFQIDTFHANLQTPTGAADGTNSGALQPFDVWHVAIPRPCLPPKMKPPLIRLGTTIRHLALSGTSSGCRYPGLP
jgi:hypothetical protein